MCKCMCVRAPVCAREVKEINQVSGLCAVFMLSQGQAEPSCSENGFRKMSLGD